MENRARHENASIAVEWTQDIRYFTHMPAVGYTYWQDGDMWLGYLDEFPDCMTQGSSLEDLMEHLLDLHKDLSSGAIPLVRRHAELPLTGSVGN